MTLKKYSGLIILLLALSKLDYLLDDKKVNRVKFRTESKKTYEDLTQTLQMITRAQVNLEKKAKELSSQ